MTKEETKARKEIIQEIKGLEEERQVFKAEFERLMDIATPLRKEADAKITSDLKSKLLEWTDNLDVEVQATITEYRLDIYIYKNDSRLRMSLAYRDDLDTDSKTEFSYKMDAMSDEKYSVDVMRVAMYLFDGDKMGFEALSRRTHQEYIDTMKAIYEPLEKIKYEHIVPLNKKISDLEQQLKSKKA